MMSGAAAGRPDVDLLDPQFDVGDPHPVDRWIRADDPIYRDERNAFWCVTPSKGWKRSSAGAGHIT